MNSSEVKVLILAAGTGSRLMPLTVDRPKALVPLFGKTILARQLTVMRQLKISEISIVTGHQAAKLEGYGLITVHNTDFESTNMVHSLFCAERFFDGSADLVISYGDIVYEEHVMRALLNAPYEISVAVDRGWRRLWSLRMEDPLADAETLKIDPHGRIRELGCKAASYAEIEGQYIGLVRFSKRIASRVLTFYKALNNDKLFRGRDKRNMFMTTFLQLLIDIGIEVGPAWIDHGWLELDSLDDLQKYQSAHQQGELLALYADA